MIDESKLRKKSPHPGISVACDAIQDYNNALQDSELRDFSGLEQEFLTQLSDGRLIGFLGKLNYLMVDEYQDTNLLQEQIYFQLAGAALQKGGSVAVVGDDDQSLYRFRGATVDLFEDFPSHARSQLSSIPQPIYLTNNYRSTRSIVAFVNNYVTLDRQYQVARVRSKPKIDPARESNPPYVNFPVLGMFRPDLNKLSHDLAGFVHSVVKGPGFRFAYRTKRYSLNIDRDKGGSSADVCLLSATPNEFTANGEPRLPSLVRNRLSQMDPPIEVFNPRGQDLQLTRTVRLLCGLMLECIDPSSSVQKSILSFPQGVDDALDTWRTIANQFIRSNPQPRTPISIRQFVGNWGARRPLRSSRTNRRWQVSLADIAYKLVTWIPEMQGDIENLVYLEALTRTITQSAMFSRFEAEFIYDPQVKQLETASVKEALRNIFAPLAAGAIEVNEDLYETLPSDRLNIMSIHQAKGLEFPLVIVDVGCDFRTNHHTQAFKRFPREPAMDCRMEDDLRPFSPLKKPGRSGLDRTFDDLTRKYFVAFSRAQDVLLLVGLDSARNTSNPIPNIATGWTRDQNWPWSGLDNLVQI
jgi:DNA helicase-2/ATP-dependent DNA helicase PcrA